MKQSNQEIELEHRAIDLYNIILDIESYPDYIPWCSKVEILNENKNEILANMFVSYKLFRSQKFTSKVIFDSKKLIIKTQYVKGPLKDLETLWRFIDIKNNKCKIIFSIEFEFKNFLHQKFAEIFFQLIEKKMIRSFIDRANKSLD